MLDFYLSEMSVSDRHGGGITLQRLLGADLGLIKHFVHPGRFARDFPPAPAIVQKSDYIISWFEENSARLWIGCTLSSWCHQHSVVQKRQARQTAAKIDRLFPGNSTLTALVCPQSPTSVLAIESLKTRRPLKYISWMMDDHIVRYHDGKWQYPKALRAAIGKHFREASALFVISSVMGEFYEREFGVRAQVLFGPAEQKIEPICDALRTSGPLTIGYFGSVGPWQLDALVRFAATLPPDEARLHVFTNADVLPPALQLPAVEFKACLAKEAVQEKMREYDAVLLPISFDESQRHLSEFNIATKMSECLASGTVTLVVGPEYAAMVRFLQLTGAACVITDRSLADWPRVADKLKDPAYRRQVLDAAKDLVQKELSTSVMRSRWRTAVSKLTEPNSDTVSRREMIS